MLLYQRSAPTPAQAPLSTHSATTSATAEERNNAPERVTSTPSRVKATPTEAELSKEVSIRAAFEQWLAATNAQDLERVMSFYLPRIEAFYLAQNVSREAVRAEKTRAYRQAKEVEERTSAPEINFSPDGRTGTMRFRKQYVTGGGPQSRHGEVIQELRWQLTAEGWKISSERDIQVLR